VSGRFVVLEGIDGCGSTTQARLLARALEARGHAVESTCEPSSGPIGALIRRALQQQLHGPSGEPRQPSWATMALLFAADRLDHVDHVIRPALARGALVISDRYDLSSLTYQSATAPAGADVLAWLRALNAEAVRPDLTIVLDVSPEVARTRRLARGGPEEIYERTELQHRLSGMYSTAERYVPGDRVVHVSADAGVEQVAAAVLAAVLEAMPPA
jgi:dTMP kinase